MTDAPSSRPRPSGSTFTLYPAVDIRAGRAVRLVQGAADAETVYDDDPVAAARRWAAAGASWLHVVDLDAAFTGEPRNRHLVADIVGATGLPVQASGGIRSASDVEALLALGAARVVIGTRALTDPDEVAGWIERWSDRIAVGLDVRGTTLQARGWTEPAGELFEVLAVLTAAGVARVVYTDVARDGMLAGPDVAGLAAVAEATTASVTASGGVSGLDDLRVLAACHPRVDGAIIGTALYAGRFRLEDALATVAA